MSLIVIVITDGEDRQVDVSMHAEPAIPTADDAELDPVQVIGALMMRAGMEAAAGEGAAG